MNAEALELALRKQRLQLRSAALRDEFMDHASALEPLCAAGDRVRDAARWLRGHPEAVVGVAVAALVARPRAILRWARRAFFAWRASEKIRAWLTSGERRP